MDNMKKFCETMMKQDNEQMIKMMDMCKSMFENPSEKENCCTSDCCSNEVGNTKDNKFVNEMSPLFDEWVNEVRDEVELYLKEQPGITLKDAAKHFKMSEESMSLIMKNNKADKDNYSSYEILKVEKTRNSCSLCEEYVHKNETKPIVVMSCEGACLRGEIARKAANSLCHTVIPNETVRLCLGSALTKQGGQRSLVKNAQKLIALEGCPVDCGSRLIRGISCDINPEVIRTDILADFDKCLFGIDGMSEEEINKISYQVALQIAEKIK